MPVATRRPVPDRLPPLELPDLAGRRMVITGATSGIGLESAIALAQARAALVLGVRDIAKGEAAADRIRERVPSARVAVEQIELGSLASVASRLLAAHSSSTRRSSSSRQASTTASGQASRACSTRSSSSGLPGSPAWMARQRAVER